MSAVYLPPAHLLPPKAIVHSGYTEKMKNGLKIIEVSPALVELR
jgi:hypothetical protein